MKSIVAVLGLLAGAAQAHVAIDVCGETVAFKQVPKRAIANDINMLKIMVALDLTANMAGYSGVSAHHKMPDDSHQAGESGYDAAKSVISFHDYLLFISEATV